jgi:hypothetical protein
VILDVTRGYQALSALLHRSHLAAQHHMPALVRQAAAELGAADAVVHLTNLQQTHLIPFLHVAGRGVAAEALPIDSTLAGRSFQFVEVLTQAGEEAGTTRVWLPLVDGTERLGVLALSFPDTIGVTLGDEAVRDILLRFTTAVAELVMTKTMYGDEIVRLRRRTQMGLAAELQWSLLPPLTFACPEVTIAGALEPAYRVAGDTVDYAVDAGLARAAVFDGMGHDLRSSQLASIAVASYRNGRRNGLDLPATGRNIDEALQDAFDGTMFATGVLVELDTHSGLLSWINAGHPPPLLLREHHVVKVLEGPARPPLGLRLPQASESAREFVVSHEQLQPGDHVLLYTDGVTEARSPEGDFFGEQRLTDLLMRNFAAGLPASETMRRLVRELLAHQQGQLSDDATLLLVEWRSVNLADVVPGPVHLPGTDAADGADGAGAVSG